MQDTDRIAATIRREYASLVGSGAYKGLFISYPAGASVVPTPNGPPLFVPGGVPAGSYVFRDDQTILTAAEFHAVCARLTPPTATEPKTAVEAEEHETPTEEEPQTPPPERPQTFKSGAMDPAEKARARARAQANRHG